MVVLSTQECRAVHELIGMLSGHNPENVFAWDGSDSQSDPTISALAKIYRAAGERVPDVGERDVYAEVVE